MYTADPRQRGRDLWELTVGYGLILACLWTPGFWQRSLYLAAALFLAAVTVRGFRGWAELGLSFAAMRRAAGPSALLVGTAALLASATLLLAARLGALHAPPTVGLFIVRYRGYLLWAFAQQILLQDFFLRRLLRLRPGRSAQAALAAAAVFAAAHLPSPVLASVTLLWGAVACFFFVRYRTLLPLGLAHAIFGITLSVSLPAPLIRNMRVGLGYLTYHAPHPHREDRANTIYRVR